MSRTALIILYCLAFPAMILAQKETVFIDNVEQAITVAINNNSNLKAAQSKEQQAKYLRGTTSNIGKTGIYHSYDANNLAPNNRALRVYGVYQKIPFPTVFSSKDHLYQIRSEQAVNYYDYALWRLKEEVSKSYYSCVYHQNRLLQYTYLDSIFSTFSGAADKRYELGESTYLEKISARNYYQQQRIKKDQADEEYKIAYNQLVGLLQFEGIIQLSSSALEILDWSLELENTTPMQKLLANQVNESTAEWKVAKSQSMPDISVEYFKGFGIGENSQNFNGYMIGLEIPLWFRPYHKYSQAAKIQTDQAHFNWTDYEQRLSAKRSQLTAELEKYKTSIDYFEGEGLPMAKEIQKAATQSYFAGEISYMNYIQSLEGVTRSYLQYLDDVHLYNQTYISLYYLTDVN